jgi:hypothetical protein
VDPIPAGSEAPEADGNQDGDEAKGSLEESDTTTSPPLLSPKIEIWRKRGSA